MRFVPRFTLLSAVVAAPILVLAAVSIPAASAATPPAALPAHAGYFIRITHPATTLSPNTVCDGHEEAIIETPNHGQLYVDPNNDVVNGSYSHETQWCVIDVTQGGASAEYREQGTSYCLTDDEAASLVTIYTCGSGPSSHQTWYWTEVSDTCPGDDFAFFTSEYQYNNTGNVLWDQTNDTPVYFAAHNCTALDDSWGSGP